MERVPQGRTAPCEQSRPADETTGRKIECVTDYSICATVAMFTAAVVTITTHFNTVVSTARRCVSVRSFFSLDSLSPDCILCQ